MSENSGVAVESSDAEADAERDELAEVDATSRMSNPVPAVRKSGST